MRGLQKQKIYSRRYAGTTHLKQKIALNTDNMASHKEFFNKENSLLYLILFLFFLSKITILLFQKNIWWDAAVYAGMGKYIFSFGNSGLWEASRPVAWPLLLGLIWKFNIDVVLFGKILSLLFSVGVLLLTYLISKEIFNKKTALLSIILLALTPTFYFFSTIMLSGIASTFFVLLAVYFLIKKNYLMSGLFFGLGFMTRFLQLISFAVIFILFFIYKKDNDFKKNIINLLIGFFIPVVPYLILNYFLYNNILHPFLLQLFLTKVTGWMYLEPFWFYFAELFQENFLYIFFIIGIFYSSKNKLNLGKNIVLYLFLVFFLVFIFIRHKEMRFLLLLFPYLCILASYGIIRFLHAIKNRNIKRGLIFSFSILFVFQSLYNLYFYEKTEISKGNSFIEFQSFLDKDNLGGIWISNPAFAVYSDKKINTLIYYPTFDIERINFLDSNLHNADTILIDTCDIPCNPNDIQCPGKKGLLISEIRDIFKIIYDNKYGNCEQFIFAKG